MLTKLTAKKQITLPKNVIARFGPVDYFDVTTDGETIVLHPIRASRAGEVRTRLAQLGVNDTQISDAIAWARQPE